MPESQREAGAILIIALVFMIVGALLVLPLARLATTNLADTSGLANQRQVQSAADGATEMAIEQIRYSTTQGYPTGGCSLSPNTVSLNGFTIRVDCTSHPLSSNPANQSRNVSFVACPSTDATMNCPGQDLLDAQVVYFDFTPSIQLQVGYSSALISWFVKPANA